MAEGCSCVIILQRVEVQGLSCVPTALHDSAAFVDAVLPRDREPDHAYPGDNVVRNIRGRRLFCCRKSNLLPAAEFSCVLSYLCARPCHDGVWGLGGWLVCSFGKASKILNRYDISQYVVMGVD